MASRRSNILTGFRNYGARIAACGLVLLAAWEIGVLVAAGSSSPSRDDWKAARAVVQASADTGDLIVFAPRWLDPMGRLWFGERLSLDQAARANATRYGRVWEISIRGAVAPEVAGEQPVTDQTVGRIRVRQFVRPTPRITWDLDGQSQIHAVDFEPRKGVLLELRRAGDERRLRFPDVPLGDELHVYAGLANAETRLDDRATALVQVLVDGREITRGYVGHASGWLALPVGSVPSGLHDVELVARAHDARGPAHLAVCVAAESWASQ
jgi:hypothetical protein